MRRRERGFTLLEVVVSMVLFGIFLMILVVLTAEMNNYEKKLPINFMKHPQVSAVVSRLRRDVLDASSGIPGTTPYLPQWPPGPDPQYTNSKQLLIIRTMEPDLKLKTVVWDFREEGIVTRRSYNVGVPTDWIARGLPPDISYFDLGAEQIAGRDWAVRLKAVDKKGRVALDQIFQPRAHQ